MDFDEGEPTSTPQPSSDGGYSLTNGPRTSSEKPQPTAHIPTRDPSPPPPAFVPQPTAAVESRRTRPTRTSKPSQYVRDLQGGAGTTTGMDKTTGLAPGLQLPPSASGGVEHENDVTEAFPPDESDDDLGYAARAGCPHCQRREA